jgi:hypothetical protein
MLGSSSGETRLNDEPDKDIREHRLADDILGKGTLVAGLFALILCAVISCNT